MVDETTKARTTHHRALQSIDVIQQHENDRLIAALSTNNNNNNNNNETSTLLLSERLSVAAHSYCDGNDLEEYPLPKYDVSCSPYSTLNVIPFFGGMSNALKFILLGALMSFEENRCFHVSEQQQQPPQQHAQLGLFNNSNNKDGRTDSKETFLNHFFEGIGLPANHPFVQERMASGNYEVRGWKSYWGDLTKRRIERKRYNFTTLPYSHPVANVNGMDLKRDALRHLWHLKPKYRDDTCRALQDSEILFDTDYIALSIRRGDKRLEKHYKPPTMAKYIEQAERVIPYVFASSPTTSSSSSSSSSSDTTTTIPKLFVATDDCTILPTLRKARPQWMFISECDNLSEPQTGYEISGMPKMNEERREQHFRKFFIELYAMSLAKVFIGVSYTNVSWFAYMMRPNVDKATFVLLDRIGLQERTISQW